MGRYAQARKRGRGINQTPVTLAPPATGLWGPNPNDIIHGVTFSVDVEIDDTPPAPADGYAARFSDDNTSWIAQAPLSEGSVFTSQAFAWGDTAYAQVAWFLGAVQVSEWSTSKTATHP